MRRRILACLLGLATLTAGCTDPARPVAGAPAALDIVSGNLQSGTVGVELVDPLVIRIVDSQDVPVGGQIVNFRVIGGGGSVFAGSALTNDDGRASERWTLGTSTADSQVVEVRAVDPATGEALVFGRFYASAAAGPVATITRLPESQPGVVGAVLAESLLVRALDKYSNPVPNTVVAFAPVGGTGSLSPAGSSTSATGYASTRWTAPTVPGTYTATATMQGVDPVTFGAQVSAGAASLVVVESTHPGSLTAGSTVQTTIRVVDSFGNPVPGAAIGTSVTGGAATVVTSPGATNAEGRAVITWKLGAAVATNTLQVSAAPGTPASLTITGTAGVASQMSKTTGDNQIGAPGTALSVIPAVRIFDPNGINPVAGVTVNFTVSGGSIADASAVTNANGEASAGTWTLGATKGSYILTAAASGVPSVSFTAQAGASSPDVTVTFQAPSADQHVPGDTLTVSAVVMSLHPLASVKATVGSRTVDLVGQGSTKTGKVVLTGLAWGEHDLIVTATDDRGVATDVIRKFVRDQKPVVTVTSPSKNEFSGSTANVAATCADDGPTGCTLKVLGPDNAVLLTGSSSLSGTVSLAAYLGTATELSFVATDSRGATTIVKRLLFVQKPGSRLTAVAAVEGSIEDYDGTRILYKRPSGAKVIRTLATGAEVTLPIDSISVGSSGLLTPMGAMYPDLNVVHEVRNGVLISRTGVGSFRIAGNYASFVQKTGNQENLIRLDLVSNTQVSIGAAGWFTLASNGDVVYASGASLYRYRNGQSALLASGTTLFQERFPETDGINVVYARDTIIQCTPTYPCGGRCTSGPYCTWTGVRMITAAGASIELQAPGPLVGAPHFVLREGWVAFPRPNGLSGLQQIWTRAPDGTLRQLTSGTSATENIDELRTDGTVAYYRYLNGDINRKLVWIASPGGTPEQLEDNIHIGTLGTQFYAVTARNGSFLFTVTFP